ncbi:putative molybdenum carrier protein [Chlorobaculum sp. MV4-Y]|uniref:putative molybdenum carrier protein n=1 Tax=Chlorobaculum sp. MV4-Y TaxID=2976335 RepID=UPI0021AEAEDB|nr:putative molybdenum carrier protein [Chlorobaculum sp. MV4-Y]UWX58168.1 putative molybdenum carrier protein [Chlorobaculum sp. MV4-Y]
MRRIPGRSGCGGLSMIVSGGQAGVDRGALDAAIAAGFVHGGWCPRGRRAEDGVIPEKYRLVETPYSRYAVRTAWNVHDSDATLVLTSGPLAGGTKLTVEYARRYGRACMIVDLDGRADAGTVVEWIGANGIGVLNIAGPRESEKPGIGENARRFVLEIIDCDRRRTLAGS